jgi:hypothetical protein
MARISLEHPPRLTWRAASWPPPRRSGAAGAWTSGTGSTTPLASVRRSCATSHARAIAPRTPTWNERSSPTPKPCPSPRPTVTDAMTAALREHLDKAQPIELSMTPAVKNQRARLFAGLEIAPQGFRDRRRVSAS